MRNLKEQVKKAFCYQKLFRPFTVRINCYSNLKFFCKFLAFSLKFQKFFSIPRTFVSHRSYLVRTILKQNTIPAYLTSLLSVFNLKFVMRSSWVLMVCISFSISSIPFLELLAGSMRSSAVSRLWRCCKAELLGCLCSKVPKKKR